MKIYSQPGCGKCQVAKRMMEQKGLVFEVEDSSAEVMAVAREIGKNELPFLKVNGEWFTGSGALDRVKEM